VVIALFKSLTLLGVIFGTCVAWNNLLKQFTQPLLALNSDVSLLICLSNYSALRKEPKMDKPFKESIIQVCIIGGLEVFGF